jgi:outer membrane receptor protein involved in Fe transport
LVAATLCAAAANPLYAQQPARPDTTPSHGDTLMRAPVQLQAVTITASAPQREEASGAIMVTPTVMARTPAANPYDLLRLSAGIEVHDQGQGPGFASNAAVRGFSSDHSTDLALWIDGVPINEPVNGHAEGYADWSLLLPQAVQGIDVIKGPTSVLFGNFAHAGVINVRTVERQRGTRGWLSGGSFGRLDAGVLTGFDHLATGGVFGVRVVREDGWRPNSGSRLGQGHARVVHTMVSGATLDAALELYGADWDSPGFITDSAFAAHAWDTVANATDGGFKRRAQERVSLRVPVGPSALWRSTAYATESRWQLYLTTPPEGGGSEGSGSQTEEEDRRTGLGVTSALTWATGRTEVSAGGELRWDHSDYQQWFTTDRVRDSAGTDTDVRQIGAALFGDVSHDMGRHVRLRAGGRYDVLDTRATPAGGAAGGATRAAFSPKLGALVHLRHALSAYANVSRGFRHSDGVVEDPTLGLITAWAYETGVKLDRRRLTGSLALFREDVSNEQSFDPVTLTRTNGGASRHQGLEVELGARFTPAVTARMDGTLNDARYERLITEDGDTLAGARVFNTARYTGAVTLAFQPPAARWYAQLTTNVVGPYSPFDEPGVVLPAYALWHLSAGVDLGPAQLRLGVRNLFNRVYPELRAGGFVAPGQPRTVYASLEYR